VTPRSTRTSSSRLATPCRRRCSKHQLAGPVLVCGGGHDQGAHRQAGHIDGHDALGALGAAVGPALVVEREASVRGATGEVGVDDDHRGRPLGAPMDLAYGLVQHRHRACPGSVSRPAAKLRPHSGPGAEGLRQVAPLAPGLSDVEHGVDDAAQITAVLAAAFARRSEHRLEQFPLLRGEVTWVRHTSHSDHPARHGNRGTPS
jgi:hypothetical protein